MNNFVETLRRLRIEKGLSQQQLADHLHASRPTVAYWEASRRIPDATMIAPIADALGVDIEALIKPLPSLLMFAYFLYCCGEDPRKSALMRVLCALTAAEIAAGLAALFTGRLGGAWAATDLTSIRMTPPEDSHLEFGGGQGAGEVEALDEGAAHIL